MRHEPGYTDTPYAPYQIENMLLAEVPPSYYPLAENQEELLDSVTVAQRLGFGGSRPEYEVRDWIAENVTLMALVRAAAREAQSVDHSVDAVVTRSATAVLGSAIKQYETLHGGEAPKIHDHMFLESAQVLLGLYDRNLNPKRRSAPGNRTPTFAPRTQPPIANEYIPASPEGRLRSIAENISAVGWHGKVTPGTILQAGLLPAIDIYQPSGYGNFAYRSGDKLPEAGEYGEKSPLKTFLERQVTALGKIIYAAKYDFEKGPNHIPDGDNHFLSCCYDAYGLVSRSAWVIFGRNNTADDVDRLGRSPGIQSLVVEVPVADAVFLEQNPTLMPRFVDIACPGLDRPRGARPGSPGLTTDPSRRITVISYAAFEQTIESISRPGSIVEMAFDTNLGDFSGRWAQAAHPYPYMPAGRG